MRFDYQTWSGRWIEKKELSEEHQETMCTESEQRSVGAQMITRNPCLDAWPPLPRPGTKFKFEWLEIHSNASSAGLAITLAVFREFY